MLSYWSHACRIPKYLKIRRRT